MDIGFVNFNLDERTTVYKVLQMLREKGTIDELGIGRIRDAFSDAMFPGTSVLQGHAKYFVVLPSLFVQLLNKRKYISPRDANEKIIDMEINLTLQLLAGTEEKDQIAIVGGDTLKKALADGKKTAQDKAKYVLYDPVYIYKNGMQTYNIIRTSGNIYRSISDWSKIFKDQPERKIGDTNSNKTKNGKEIDENGMDDAIEFDTTGKKPPFDTCGEEYDFTKNGYERPMSIRLTKNEAGFLKRHIVNSCPDTLLTYILKTSQPIDKDYFKTGALLLGNNVPESCIRPYILSVHFSRFVRLLHIIYEIVYAKKTEDEKTLGKVCGNFMNCISDNEYVNACRQETVATILEYVGLNRTDPLRHFCEKASTILSEYISSGSAFRMENITDLAFKEEFEPLETLVIRRERDVKGDKRSKLFNADKTWGRHGLSDPLTFRWRMAYTLITEINEGLKNE